MALMPTALATADASVQSTRVDPGAGAHEHLGSGSLEHLDDVLGAQSGVDRGGHTCDLRRQRGRDQVCAVGSEQSDRIAASHTQRVATAFAVRLTSANSWA